MTSPASPLYASLLAAQTKASDPHSSAWVSANAGSGKTHVLTQRVIRLLIDGVDPSRILCLTFTKAAAANMATRVFKTLSGWTALDDAGLAKALVGVGLEPADARDKRAFARKLFARAIETPGGLKIQTIHAFCEKLLHLFPFEANVAAGFRVIEDREAKELREDARHAAFVRSETSPELAAAIQRIAELAGAGGFDGLIAEALGKREDIEAYGGVEAYRERLRVRLGLEPQETEGELDRAMIEGGAGRARWREWAKQLGGGLKTDKERAALLIGAAAGGVEALTRLSLYQDAFFTQAGPPRKVLLTKGVAERFPDLGDELYDEQGRLEALRQRRRLAQTLSRSADLIRVADSVLSEYARLKNARGWLDFDDLAERTRTLLTKSDATWVLRKLDGGVDHFLVDEAQDTSRPQWEILQKLAEDFLSGLSQSSRRRTFFAVGDEKQSIFSFQGAAPDMFDAMRRDFARRHRAAQLRFEPVLLRMSFRSSPTILDAVDAIFKRPEASAGLSVGDLAELKHEAFYADLPGLLEIWESIQPEPHPDPEDWRMPLDAASRADPAIKLADRIAQTIDGWLAPHSSARVVDKHSHAPRPVRAGDILVLVRSRGKFYEAMTRALRRRRIAFAGADRLTLSDHIAVLDLVSAGRAALTRDDDLALAEVLKSPLIGLSDEDLLKFAPRRDGSLADALDNSSFVSAALRMNLWRERARQLSPYDFYARLIGVDGGRRALIGRLGPEAADAIDEFLALALACERDHSPSLSAFLDEVAASDQALKRDMEAEAAEVRVMTVHAAKGLEAPIVFLPDTAGAPDGKRDPKWLQLEPASLAAPALYVWGTSRDEDAPPLTAARAAHAGREAGEHRRLLYVALTRAAERLVICAFEGASGRKSDCWYDLIRAGLEAKLTPAPAPWDPSESVWRFGRGVETTAPPEPQAAPAPIELPAWAETAAAREIETAALAPSRVFAPETSADGEARRLRREAGRLAHALLQHLPELPPTQRQRVARNYLDTHGRELPGEQRAEIAERVLRLIDDPDLAALFGPNSRGEVAISALRPLAFSGRIDRLAVADDAVWLVDFKSGDGGAKRGEIAQLALYRSALAAIYRRPVHGWIVRLPTGAKERIADADLDEALAGLRSLDPQSP